jgi:Uma2 family endonuclease
MVEVGAMVVQKKLYTVDEFEEFIRRVENADRLFELIDGEIVEKVPTELHSMVAGNFYASLREFVKPRGLGRVVFEVRYRLPGDEHNARIPDVSFTSKGRLLPVVEEGAVPLIPDLCIEVQSPDDSPKQMRDKAAYYLANGARLVWLVYPKKRMVEALYPNGEFDIFTEDDTLSGGDVLPDFTLAVRDVFEV